MLRLRQCQWWYLLYGASVLAFERRRQKARCFAICRKKKAGVMHADCLMDKLTYILEALKVWQAIFGAINEFLRICGIVQNCPDGGTQFCDNLSLGTIPYGTQYVPTLATDLRLKQYVLVMVPPTTYLWYIIPGSWDASNGDGSTVAATEAVRRRAVETIFTNMITNSYY